MTTLTAQQEDPFLFLEDIDSKGAMDFVNAHNTSTVTRLMSEKTYAPIYNKVLEALNSTDRIAYPTIAGDYIYNFWQDAEHVRGIWRRALKVTYMEGSPEWETLLDLDAMSAKDQVMWVFKGAGGLYPKYNRFLISLSKGGGDAIEVREFDVQTRNFVRGGFHLEESKGGADYVDENTLIVSTDFGPGSMTTSGYPNQVKLWERGTPLSAATLLFEGDTTDVGTWGYVLRDGDLAYTTIVQAPTIFTSSTYILVGDTPVKLDIPTDASIKTLLKDQLILSLKTDWEVAGTRYPQGALLSIQLSSLLEGKKEIRLILVPDEWSSVEEVYATKNKLLVNMTTNVKSVLNQYTLDAEGWHATKVGAPDLGTISIDATDVFSDVYFFDYTNFLTPTTLYVADAQTHQVTPLKSLPAFFDASKYKTEQFKVKSKDGTMIPYFVVSSKTIKYDGLNPTLLNAYGGFEVSMLPYYISSMGSSWLDNGGVYVLANIRGGGEFGPKWHQAGLKEKRQNVYDDFFAVTQDLITRKITIPKHLGIKGGSNGGLLMGVAFTQHPELYNAVLCEVPLLDMKRYNKLLAGASWMGEYGNPDIPEEWAYISKYSPYQNIKPGMKYPEVFFVTSTRDDRVHPGHARKMVARMEDLGYKVYSFENVEGGHGAASTNEQRAKMVALEYAYLLMKLK